LFGGHGGRQMKKHRPQIIMKIKDTIKNWYRGQRVEIRLPKDMIGLPVVNYTQPSLARFLKVIGNFWLNQWKWIITTTITIIAIYITYLKLIKSK
jgi:hypothetical protein